MLPELADAFAKTRDPTMQARMAFALFGRAGQELLPVLMQGSEKLREMVEPGAKFADFGSPEQREKLKEFGHAWGEMDAAAEGFKTRLATELAPVLMPIVEMARDWIMANRDWIATNIADKVRMLATEIRKLDLHEIIRETSEWAKWIYHLIDSHGSFITVLGALTLMLGSPLIDAISNLIGMFKTLGGVLLWLGELMWANPILAAVGRVAVAAFLLYENWD